MRYLLFLPLLIIYLPDFGFSVINKVLIVLILLLLIIMNGSAYKLFLIDMILILLLFIIGLVNLEYFSVSALVDFLFFITFIGLSFGKNYFIDNLEDFYKLLLKFIIISFGLSLVYVILLFLSGKEMFEFDYGSYRFIGPTGAAGSAIYYVALFIPIFINYKYYKEKKYLLLSLFLAALIISTGSRMAFLVLMVVVFIQYFQSANYKFKVIYTAAFFVILAYVIVLLGQRMFFGDNISFESLNLSGRNILWAAVINHSFDSIYFGHGHGAATNYLLDLKILGGKRDYQVHNDYIRIYYNFGLIGLSIFLYLLFRIYKKIKFCSHFGFQENVLSQISLSYFIGFLMLMFTDNIILYYFYFYFFLIFFFYMFTYSIQKEEEELSNE